jgi:hypothetical protein
MLRIFIIATAVNVTCTDIPLSTTNTIFPLIPKMTEHTPPNLGRRPTQIIHIGIRGGFIICTLIKIALQIGLIFLCCRHTAAIARAVTAARGIGSVAPISILLSVF